MRALTDADVERLVPINEVVEAVEEAFKSFSLGSAVMPLRTRIEATAYKGDILLMPCYLQEMNIFSVKLVTVYPENISRGLPTIHAVVLVADPSTGEPKVAAEARALTGMRTGAATAVSVKHLARRDSRVVGIIGCGYQARWQLLALATVMKPDNILAYDIDRDRASGFVRRMKEELKCEVSLASSAESLARESDVIITVTTSKTPVVKAEWVKPGTHISAIGAYTPEMSELEPALIKRSKVVVDSLDAARAEAGDIIQAVDKGFFRWEDIHAEIGEVIAGRKPGREGDEEITVFKSVGLAVQDAAASKVLLNHLNTR